jgi:hypothetical protein
MNLLLGFSNARTREHFSETGSYGVHSREKQVGREDISEVEADHPLH